MAGDAAAPTEKPLRPLVALSPRAYSKISRADPPDALLGGPALYRITTIIKRQLGAAGSDIPPSPGVGSIPPGEEERIISTFVSFEAVKQLASKPTSDMIRSSNWMFWPPFDRRTK